MVADPLLAEGEVAANATVTGLTAGFYSILVVHGSIVRADIRDFVSVRIVALCPTVDVKAGIVASPFCVLTWGSKYAKIPGSSFLDRVVRWQRPRGW